jgi:lysozyme
MDIDKLRQELEYDEGVEYKIYHDHLGYPTFGIGHLVLQSDPEFSLPLGSPVSEERVAECFNQDIETTISECKILYDNFDELPEEVQRIIANMMFNMGRPRLSKFKKMKAAVDESNWSEASVQMADSKWHKVDVPTRAQRLVKRMENIST